MGKAQTKGNWKIRGVIWDDFDNLWQMYCDTTNCEECGVLLFGNGSFAKCLDHDHKTGNVRNIVCKACNNTRREPKSTEENAAIVAKRKEYMKECNAKWRQNNNEHKKAYDKEYQQANKKKVTCSCGAVVAKTGLCAHKKTHKHLNLI